jgi:hypothetical protein
LLISIIASDSDTIGDTFEGSVSVSPILLRGCIAIGIGDTFLGCIGIDYRRYFWRVSLTYEHKSMKKQIAKITENNN